MGLLQAIEGYLRAHRMTPSRFGRLAINDPHLVESIRRGRTLRPETDARVRRFIAAAGASR